MEKWERGLHLAQRLRGPTPFRPSFIVVGGTKRRLSTMQGQLGGGEGGAALSRKVGFSRKQFLGQISRSVRMTHQIIISVLYYDLRNRKRFNKKENKSVVIKHTRCGPSRQLFAKVCVTAPDVFCTLSWNWRAGRRSRSAGRRY